MLSVVIFFIIGIRDTQYSTTVLSILRLILLISHIMLSLGPSVEGHCCTSCLKKVPQKSPAKSNYKLLEATWCLPFLKLHVREIVSLKGESFHQLCKMGHRLVKITRHSLSWNQFPTKEHLLLYHHIKFHSLSSEKIGVQWAALPTDRTKPSHTVGIVAVFEKVEGSQ